MNEGHPRIKMTDVICVCVKITSSSALVCAMNVDKVHEKAEKERGKSSSGNLHNLEENTRNFQISCGFLFFENPY